MSAPLLSQPPLELKKRFFKPASFPIKSNGPITALDWDGRSLRLAQSVGRGGKAEIERVVTETLELEFDVAKGDPVAAGACLAQALRRLRIKPGAVVMGIPRSLVFLRTLSLPQADTAETLVSMVYFQINRDLPFRSEDAIIDFQVNTAPNRPAAPAADESGAEAPAAPPKVEVLVTVAKRDVVQFYERVAAAAGLRLAALGFQSYANARGLAAGWPAEARGTVALLSLRQREVIIDIVANGTLLFSRTASVTRAEPVEDSEISTEDAGLGGAEPGQGIDPALTLADDARLVELIGIEVVRSLHNYTGSDGSRPVEAILLAGESPQAQAIVEALADRCKLPCLLLASVPPSAAGVAPKQAGRAADALTAVGLALSAQDQTAWPFNFLAPKRPPAARTWRRSRWLAVAAAAAVLLAGAWGLRAALMHRGQVTLDKLQAQLGLAVKNHAIYQDMRIRAKVVHDWETGKKEWLDHWAALSLILPDCTEVYVTSIAAGARGVLHISLQARSGEILAQVDKRLRDAGYELRPLAVTPTSDRYGYSFQTSLELTLPAKLKQDWKVLKAAPRPADDGSLERRK